MLGVTRLWARERGGGIGCGTAGSRRKSQHCSAEWWSQGLDSLLITGNCGLGGADNDMDMYLADDPDLEEGRQWPHWNASMAGKWSSQDMAEATILSACGHWMRWAAGTNPAFSEHQSSDPSWDDRDRPRSVVAWSTCLPWPQARS
jgi:hypothetical protein